MLNLLLLEDEPVLRQELSEFLSHCGYHVEAVGSVAEFDACFNPGRHRLAVFDLGLPDGDGLDLIKRLRAADMQLGVVVFTARGSVAQKVRGLYEGADYYLSKTADLEELAASLSALVRRLGPAQGQVWRLDVGPRQLLPPGHGPIALSHQDFVVLNALMQQAGVAVNRRHIVEALGEDFLSYDQRRLDTQIRRLRRKVSEATGYELSIKTVRNGGYTFYAPALIQD